MNKNTHQSTWQSIPEDINTSEPRLVEPFSLFSTYDIELFQSGKHFRLYEKMGAHKLNYNGLSGIYFAVWAPHANALSVIGDFNKWNHGQHSLFPRWDHSGIWEGFIPHLANHNLYKYAIETKSGERIEKADPFANYCELKPKTASITYDLKYKWTDGNWMRWRKNKNALNAPFSVYELHLGSWKRPDPNNEDSYYTYEEIGKQLIPYVQELGFTHIELMPVMEHPFDGSWGYQQTGYFAATSRYGSPQELMKMVQDFHKAGIGVILDWVPSHFPGDAHGLHKFDGSYVYESEDPRRGFQPDWKSYVFNYERGEVRSFLNSSAFFWLDKFHVDGLRVDGITSFLYRNFSREDGEWEPNKHGGNENLEAIDFLQEFNKMIYREYPDVQTIAEESTDFKGVSRPVYTGGLGFGMKWMMGWMHDTLKYFHKDAYFRQWHQDQITFSLVYAFNENFMLPLSHDEVVHGKSPLIYKMSGDEWQKFANLRTLYTYMFTHPGSKLLFMGGEFAQTSEWNYQTQLDWHLLQYPPHQGIKKLVQDLNKLYRTCPALYEKQFDPEGFEWIDTSDYQRSILVYKRMGKRKRDDLLIILNMTTEPRKDYFIGLSEKANWKEIFNSDAHKYGGSNIINDKRLRSSQTTHNGKPYSIKAFLPPLGAIVLKRSHGKT